MQMKNIHTHSLPFTAFATPEKARSKVRAALDRLVFRAALGNRHAIGALALAFDTMLLGEIAEEIDDGVDAEDVLQDFFVRLLEQRWTFVPGRHHAIPWLKANVRALARGEDP